MRVVVTGATGFIGRALCAELVGTGHAVTALSRDPERARAVLGSQVRSVAWSAEQGKREEGREKKTQSRRSRR